MNDITCLSASLVLVSHTDRCHFQPTLDNMHALVHSFNNPAESRREGLKFEDVVYDCVRADKFSVYAKHVSKSLN